MKTASSSSNFKLFHEIGRSLRGAVDPEQMLQSSVDAIGSHFGLDRCLILLVNDADHEISISAQFNRDPLKPIENGKYTLRANSEWHRLLLEGKPLPLLEVQAASSGSAGGELNSLAEDTQSKLLLVFPLLSQGKLLGCLTMHHCQEGRAVSEDLLELGEALADELACAIKQARLFQEKLVDGRVFSNCNLPLIVTEPDGYTIVHCNDAAAELLGPKSTLPDATLLDMFSAAEAKGLKEAFRQLSPWSPVVDAGQLLLPSDQGQPLLMSAYLSTVTGDGTGALHVLMALVPQSATEKATQADGQGRRTADDTTRLEELVSSLSRQLNWERITRQIIAKLHASLDRDTILQAAADSIGRALKATAVLIIRTDGPGTSMVTHEYADPNLSPLGLGRTGYLPAGAISAFKQRTTAIVDLSATKPPGLSRDEVNALLDNGIKALVGTPISSHGVPFGVIIVESDDAREWNPQELEMLETVATAAAMSLANAQSYSQVKDQLFNMNLISNLTQQLTNALDQATRTGKPEKPAEMIPSEAAATPLSVRELEVLKLIASGLANREIAQRLFLTESTVELHASRIRKKLKLKSRTALVKYACDNHLV